MNTAESLCERDIYTCALLVVHNVALKCMLSDDIITNFVSLLPFSGFFHNVTGQRWIQRVSGVCVHPCMNLAMFALVLIYTGLG